MAGRGRPRQFSIDEVLDGALALIEAEGVGALSMQALAERLGTGPATLYNYVRSRDELIDLMLGRALAQQPPVPRPGSREDWAEQVTDYLLALFRDGVRRPALLQLWHQRPQLHLGTALRGEEELRSLEQVGFSPTRAAEVYRILSSQLLGHIASAAVVAQRPDTLVIEADSTLGGAQRHLDQIGEEQIYELALRALIRGFAAELEDIREERKR
ncbi:MAG TPA: helix-turn-helix domain-containing protein [Mycobacteriales bacterium]|nr:helix-turn-helix domain-containing protein [Mycobacteriales bacterium]